MQDEDKKYEEELENLRQQRIFEKEKAQNELLIERQKTKTEKTKRGIGKIFARLISIITILIVCTAIATWIISMFLPQYVENALNIFRNIFS